MQFIAEKLTIYINANEINFADVTPYLIYAYNKSEHSTTLLKPSYLLFGVEPNSRLDAILRYFDISENTKEETVGEYLAKIRAN